MYGIQDKINQILRGAETIRKNQSMQEEIHTTNKNINTAFNKNMIPDTFNKALDACVEYRKQLDDKTSEVARLRELLNRAIDIAREYQKHACKNINEDCDWSMQGTHQKFNELCDELARLARCP